jgi:hypothetical protein
VIRLTQLAIVALAAAAALFPMPADEVERLYSRGIYPRVQTLVTPLTNQLPFALLDVLLIGAGGALLAVIGGACLSAWRTRRFRPLGAGIANVVVLAAAGYLAFLVLWGLNYRRVPLSDRIAQEASAVSEERVLQLGLRAAAALNRLHEPAHATGWAGEASRNRELVAGLAAVQRALGDPREAEPGRLKPTLLGPYFRGSGVDGMINPFGLEVLANPDLLPFERPFVAAHEWAHLAGYADEAEASFVGWLACLSADAPAQYSGWLFLYWQVSGTLAASARTQLTDALAEGPRDDLRAIVERMRRSEWPALRRAGRAVYDQYLKANRVDEGIRSYDRVVTLILRTEFADGWTPVRREITP